MVGREVQNLPSAEPGKALLARLDPVGIARACLAGSGHLRAIHCRTNRSCAGRKASAPAPLDLPGSDPMVHCFRRDGRNREPSARKHAEISVGVEAVVSTACVPFGRQAQIPENRTSRCLFSVNSPFRPWPLGKFFRYLREA